MTYWVLKAVLTPVLRLLFPVRVEGLEHVPKNGAAILASNHLSFSDSVFLPLVLRRRLTFVAYGHHWWSLAAGAVTSAVTGFFLRRGWRQRAT